MCLHSMCLSSPHKLNQHLTKHLRYRSLPSKTYATRQAYAPFDLLRSSACTPLARAPHAHSRRAARASCARHTRAAIEIVLSDRFPCSLTPWRERPSYISIYPLRQASFFQISLEPWKTGLLILKILRTLVLRLLPFGHNTPGVRCFRDSLRLLPSPTCLVVHAPTHQSRQLPHQRAHRWILLLLHHHLLAPTPLCPTQRVGNRCRLARGLA